MKPGDRILELEVSGRLGVSRSPVREALLTLAREGIVTIVPYRGAIVSTLDPEQFLALHEFRIVLEEFAVGRLVGVAKARDFRRLRANIARIRTHARAGDVAAAVEADLHSHELIVALAANPFLDRAYTELLNQFRLYISLTYAFYEEVEALADEHERLLTAIEAGDATAARALIREHIGHGFDRALADLRARTS